MELFGSTYYLRQRILIQGVNMINRDIYLKDPISHKLINQGVASVNDDETQSALDVLRYELETFVCDGMYGEGIEHILSTFLKNIDQSQQPAAWVSGFFGSGKSHLVKMLRALWMDTVFEDGATARGIAQLPQDITDSLKELSVQGKRHGRLHAASGTLGSGASGSVRLALLRIVLKSAGLPEQYWIARFVLWLKRENIYDQVKSHVEQAGFNWNEELLNLHVAEGLQQAVTRFKPQVFSSSEAYFSAINNLYPNINDISSDEMVKMIRDVLTEDGKFPLTLIVLDEVQQFIGESSDRSISVQETVEACCKNLRGKLLFIGTGQTAVTGTSNLKKLEGRFTVRVELSDADVESVIRKVVLAKKPEAKAPLEKVLQTNMGEVTRHLSGTSLGHQHEDIGYFTQDYPILPVRRRFWENTLRVLDQTGTDSQLRNQLSMVHKVIQTNLDAPLGNVVPADYLYFDSADKLLQSRMLPRNVHEKTMTWQSGSEDEKLMARACGLVFLINKIASSNNEIGIRATIDTLADLLVEDLSNGSSALRAKLPSLLEKCELLIRVGDEYRIQTEESTAWNDEFQAQRSALSSEAHRIESERDDRIRKRFGEIVRKILLSQGSSKVSRELDVTFASQLPSDANKRIYVWVRDGWSIDENSVRADARQAGNTSPTVFVFIPNRSADAIRNQIIEYKAASATLDKRGVPSSPEGKEARSAMETTRQVAEGRIRELFDDAFSGARVFQAGGNEVFGNDLHEMVHEAAGLSLLRVYPQFHQSDHTGWGKVYERAQKGAPDALKAVGDEGEPTKNAVCKALLASIGSGKRGTDIRSQFESSPYGWSRDAVDGGLQVLLVAGLIKAVDDRSRTLDPKELERKNIGKTLFKIESANITTPQRIGIRKLFQSVNISAKQGEESASVRMFLDKLEMLAAQAGGDAPKPTMPATASLSEIGLTSGNEQLLALYNKREEIAQSIHQWTNTAAQIEKRWPAWTVLKRLMSHAMSLEQAEVFLAQIRTIEEERLLLETPDPVTTLISGLSQLLRDELNRLSNAYEVAYKDGMEHLEGDSNWMQLDLEQRKQLLADNMLDDEARPQIAVQSTADILRTLDNCLVPAFKDRVAAITSRFDQVAASTTEMFEPKVQFVHIPRRTLKTVKDLEGWLEDVERQFKAALDQGPVAIR